MQPGVVFADRFRITDNPRTGGMARVWPAVDLTTGTKVALKLMGHDTPGSASPHSGRDRAAHLTALNRFHSEQALLSRLAGPGIPRMLAADLRGPHPYIAMEFIEGKSLRGFLDGCRPPLTATAAVIDQVLRTLIRVHGARIVHRDLKPANIMIADDGVVHLIDFGIAVPTDPSATRHTEDGHTPGSIGFKSPEAIRGARELGPAADMYSLGCVLHLMATGRPVFVTLSELSIEEQHRSDRPAPPLDPDLDGIPRELAELISRLLDKCPANRPTARQALDALAPLLPAVGDPPPHPELTPDPTRPVREGNRPAQGCLRDPAVRKGGARRGRPVGRDWFRGLIADAEQERAEAAGTTGPGPEVGTTGPGPGPAVGADDGPGPASRALAQTLTRAQRSWGSRDLEVNEARLLCADADRLAGNWIGAGSRYRGVAKDLAGAAHGSAAQALLLEARIGAAECRVPADDGPTTAFPAWLAVVEEIGSLPGPAPERLLRRCRELGEELAELGHAQEVAALLAGLPTGPPAGPRTR